MGVYNNHVGDNMKVKLEESDKQELFDEIIKELKEDPKRKWGAFHSNPIQRAFKDEMQIQLKIIISNVLDDDEFKSKLEEIGRAWVRKKLNENIDGFLPIR